MASGHRPVSLKSEKGQVLSESGNKTKNKKIGLPYK